MKKWIAALLAACTMLSAALGLSACGGQAPVQGEKEESEGGSGGVEETPAETAHEHAWVVSGESEATCGEAARTYYTCSCGAQKSVRGAAATGNHTFENGVCTECGYIDMSALSQEEAISAYGFFLDDADGSGTYTTGDAVRFGSYPQALVDGEEELAALAGAAGTLPTAESCGDWTSYGYYDEGAVSDYMFYKDVTVGGARYRGVYLLKYRSYYSHLEALADYSYIDENGFETETVYWFRYEPLCWTVLDYEGGALLLNAKYCIEGQPFQALHEGDKTNMVIPGTSTYINDWAASSIRAFLNGGFLALAFTEEEQELVQEVTLDNSTTGYATDAAYQVGQSATQDRVFLLSYQDMLNADYGFAEDAARSRSFTEYALIQGLRQSSEGYTPDGEPACYYMLRSAGNARYSVTGVSKMGTASFTGSINVMGTSSYDGLAYNGDMGVLPSLYLKVGK